MVPETPMNVVAGRGRQTTTAFHGPMDMFVRKIEPSREPTTPARCIARAAMPPPPTPVAVKKRPSPQTTTTDESLFKAPAPPQPRRSLLSDAFKVQPSSSTSVGGSTSTTAQRPSSSAVTAKAPVRIVASVQPHKPPQAISPAKRRQQESSDYDADDRMPSASSSAVVPFKRPAPSAHLNEGRAPSGIETAHHDSDGFPPSGFANSRVAELHVPRQSEGRLPPFVPKAARDLGKDPMVEKYRSLDIHPIAEVLHKRRYFLLPATRRIQPLFCGTAVRFEPEGERWRLRASVADESTDAPVSMIVCHELIMRVFRFTVAECKAFQQNKDSEKLNECKRNFGRLQDTLARSDIVLEVELSSDPSDLPLVKNATGISELLGLV